MAGPNDPDNKSPKAPAVPKKKPAAKPVTVNEAQTHKVYQNSAGASIGMQADQVRYPGLLTKESATQYQGWIQTIQAHSPDQWALISAHGPKMQALLWRAMKDRLDPNQGTQHRRGCRRLRKDPSFASQPSPRPQSCPALRTRERRPSRTYTGPGCRGRFDA